MSRKLDNPATTDILLIGVMLIGGYFWITSPTTSQSQPQSSFLPKCAANAPADQRQWCDYSPVDGAGTPVNCDEKH